MSENWIDENHGLTNTPPPGGWPGAPGVPENPERDGVHWVSGSLRQWKAFDQGGVWNVGGLFYDPEEWGHRVYQGPLLTPAEVAAREAAAWCAGRDAAAADADCGCDERAAVLAAQTKGERHRACSREPCCAWEAASIRDLAPPADLSAALAAREAAAREAGMREAVEAVQKRAWEIGRQECCGHGQSDGYGPPECCGQPDCWISDRDAAAAILAAIPQETPLSVEEQRVIMRAMRRSAKIVSDEITEAEAAIEKKEPTT